MLQSRSVLEWNLQMHIMKNEIHLSWVLPENDRCSEIENFRLEKKKGEYESNLKPDRRSLNDYIGF